MKTEVLCTFCKVQFFLNDNVILDDFYGFWHKSCFNVSSVIEKDSGMFLDIIIRHEVFRELNPYCN